MSGNEKLAYSILRSLDIAILRRLGPKRYEVIGLAPDFYSAFFPPTEEGPCNVPWEHSSMLEIFFEDAELFFSHNETGTFASGIWQEESKTGDESALIALAQTFDTEQIVIIRLLQDDFNERVGILRKARAQLLENRSLSHSLELYKEKSQLDGLTKVFNRAMFMESLPEEIIKSENSGHPLSILMLDIDDFKIINDTYGHMAGDAVLKDLGALLLTNLRRGDLVARYGGEEFVMLLPCCELPQALSIGEKLRAAIETHAIEGLPPITVSMGCTAWQAGDSPDGFVQRVDMALYEAKKNGKNRICMR